jgi:glycosyltransferase involved in cell wall biosynthesis
MLNPSSIKLHIFDNAFLREAGHDYEYTVSVYKAWESRGGKAFIYGPVDAEDEFQTQFSFVPLFSHHRNKFYSPIPLPKVANGLLNIIAGNPSYLGDLKKLKPDIFSVNDVVLIHTLNHAQIFAVCNWYRSLPPGNLPYLVLLFRNNNIIYPGRRLLTYYIYWIFFKLFQHSYRKGSVLYISDSEELAEEYGSISNRRVVVVPIPHIPDRHKMVRTTSPDTKPATIVYLGGAREEKGFYLLPEAIKHVLEKDGTSGVRFIIQSFVGKGAGRIILKSIAELNKLGNSVVTIDRCFDTAEYYELMSLADAIIIPYRAPFYYSRTSGIFSEALGMGKPVIVPEGTWMQRQLLRFDGAGTTFRDNDPHSLADAVLSLLKDRSAMQEKALQSSTAWLKYHNPSNYIDILLDSIAKLGNRGN